MLVVPLYTYFIVIALFASFFSFEAKNKEFYLKLFPPFFLVTLVIEIYSLYLRNIGEVNYQVYNFFTTFEFCFYQFILSYIVYSIRIKKVIKYSLVIYLIITVVNIFYIQKGKFHSITYCIGCLLIVIFCIYYFFELFRLSTSVKLKSEPSFWICSGLLFYYCCSLPLLGLVNFLYQIPELLLENIENILNVINVLLYTLFTIAFLCRLRIPKYTSR